jgi:hypothetical protein
MLSASPACQKYFPAARAIVEAFGLQIIDGVVKQTNSKLLQIVEQILIEILNDVLIPFYDLVVKLSAMVVDYVQKERLKKEERLPAKLDKVQIVTFEAYSEKPSTFMKEMRQDEPARYDQLCSQIEALENMVFGEAKCPAYAFLQHLTWEAKLSLLLTSSSALPRSKFFKRFPTSVVQETRRQILYAPIIWKFFSNANFGYYKCRDPHLICEESKNVVDLFWTLATSEILDSVRHDNQALRSILESKRQAELSMESLALRRRYVKLGKIYHRLQEDKTLV